MRWQRDCWKQWKATKVIWKTALTLGEGIRFLFNLVDIIFLGQRMECFISRNSETGNGI